LFIFPSIKTETVRHCSKKKRELWEKWLIKTMRKRSLNAGQHNDGGGVAQLVERLASNKKDCIFTICNCNALQIVNMRPV